MINQMQVNKFLGVTLVRLPDRLHLPEYSMLVGEEYTFKFGLPSGLHLYFIGVAFSETRVKIKMESICTT